MGEEDYFPVSISLQTTFHDHYLEAEMEKILVVDDERDCLSVISKVLIKENYHVEQAINGEEALRKVRDNHYDLVITDIMMPGMNGIEVMKQVKQLNEDTEVVVITGYPGMDEAIQALRAGAYDFLIKPFNIDEIKSVANECLERKRLKDQIRMMNEELKKKNMELEQANEFKFQLISITAHDIRSPLAAISGFAELILAGDHDILDIKGMVKDILDASFRLKELVNNFLSLSRLEAGKMKCHIRPVDIGSLLRVCAKNFVSRTEIHTLEIMPAPYFVLADPEYTEQILNNLIGNAIKYSPDGGKVYIYASVERDFVKICIRDNGIGVSPEEREKIFEKFYRGSEKSVAAIPGSGLGLYIVKTLVEMQGGRIWLESEPQEGSTFSFTLPFYEKDLAQV